jgi:hypothetical protein
MTANKTTAAAPRVSWTRGGWRNRSALKLMGARRGDGVLIWSGLAIPVAYVIDVYAQGEAQSVSGVLEGDFARLAAAEASAAARERGARLRLDDGREIDIDLTTVEDTSADFEMLGDGAGADLLN